MYKLIVIVAAAVPAILLLRAIYGRRSPKASRAFSDFKRQLDYLVWGACSLSVAFLFFLQRT
jgi:hypothetical protein